MSYRPEDYGAAFPALAEEGVGRVIERRLERGAGTDPLDDLVGAASTRVRAWMLRKAKLADGTTTFQLVCNTTAIREAMAAERSRDGDWKGSPRSRVRDLWCVAETGLLRDLAGLTWNEIADRCECSSATGHGRHAIHERLLLESPEYAERTSRIATDAIARCFPVGAVVRGR